VLQREIAPRAAAAKPGPQRWFEPIAAWWPRLTVGAGAVAVAAVAMLVITDIGRKTRPPMEMAKAEQQTQSAAFPDQSSVVMDSVKKLEERRSDDRIPVLAQSAPAAATAGRVVGEALDEKLKAADKLDGLQVATRAMPAKEMPAPVPPAASKPQPVPMTVASPSPAEPLPATAPLPAPAPKLAAAPSADLAKAMPSSSAKMPASPPSVPAEAEPPVRPAAGQFVTAAVSNMAPLSQRLRFAQVAAESDADVQRQSRTVQPQPSQAVLASFQLEQVGDRVVITDADGSVYEGRIQLATESQQQFAQSRRASRARSTTSRGLAPRQVTTQAGEFVWREKDAAGKREESRAAQQELFFAASGMNRSLNQRVVVNGTLSSPADGALAYGRAGGGTMTFGGMIARDSNAPAGAVGSSNAVMSEGGQIVLRAGPVAPVPAAPQASAQIEGTLRVGNTPEVEITAVGVGP
jgi:Arc/MetJ-type ribon-helix-helix transcriptional regulator